MVLPPVLPSLLRNQHRIVLSTDKLMWNSCGSRSTRDVMSYAVYTGHVVATFPPAVWRVRPWQIALSITRAADRVKSSSSNSSSEVVGFVRTCSVVPLGRESGRKIVSESDIFCICRRERGSNRLLSIPQHMPRLARWAPLLTQNYKCYCAPVAHVLFFNNASD